MSLTRSVASRNRSDGSSTARSSVRNRRRWAGAKLPMVLPRNATSRGSPTSGMPSRCSWKSPTTAWTPMPRSTAMDSAAAPASPPTRRTGRSRPGLRWRTPWRRAAAGLLRRPRAQLDQHPRLGGLGDLAGGVSQQRRLGAERVVLRKAGDVLVQRRPPVVVEPYGRHPLGFAARPLRASRRRAARRSPGSSRTSTVTRPARGPFPRLSAHCLPLLLLRSGPLGLRLFFFFFFWPLGLRPIACPLPRPLGPGSLSRFQCGTLAHRSTARRRPQNGQRAAGGKKLR